MASVEEVARGAVASVTSDASWQLVAQWVDARYKQICRRVRMRHLRDEGELFIPAPITAGTITVVEAVPSETGEYAASRIVVGDATAQAAWGSFVVGRHLKVRSVWHKIIAYQDGVLTLDSPYTESAGAGLTYHIVQRYTPLKPNVRHLGKFRHMPHKGIVRLKTLDELDEIAPSRQQIGVAPRIVAEVGAGMTTRGHRARLVECYPYSQKEEVLHYTYWREPDTLDLDAELPPNFDEDALREGVLVDLMRYEMAKAVRAGNNEGAALWRNEYRAQNTVWERYMQETIREDKGADDDTFILEEPGMSIRENSIVTAQDYVLMNWPR